jgi:hypothetical protein
MYEKCGKAWTISFPGYSYLPCLGVDDHPAVVALLLAGPHHKVKQRKSILCRISAAILRHTRDRIQLARSPVFNLTPYLLKCSGEEFCIRRQQCRDPALLPIWTEIACVRRACGIPIKQAGQAARDLVSHEI